MKKLFYYLILAILPSMAIAAKMESAKMWIEDKNVKEIQITKFKSISEKTQIAQKTINDPTYIQSLIITFNHLPEAKDIMMVKMGPNAGLTEVTFASADKTQKVVRIFNNNLQLPSTGFYSPTPPEAKELVEEIENLLIESYPYNKAVPLYQNAEFKFEHFKISYVGAEDKTPKGTTATSFVQTYKVTDNEGHSQNVEVRSGQLPPRPAEFEVNKMKFTLYNFNYKGKSLMARNIVIEKN